jgi:hypothetical protein
VKVELPSDTVERFKKGDSVPVELALLFRPSAEKAERAGLAALLLGIFRKK